MSRKQQQPIQMPTDMTQSVSDTSGDIAAYRNFDARAAINAGRGDLDSQFDRAERQTRESFGNYSGILNPFQKARGMSSSLNNIAYDRAISNANLNAQGMQAEMGQKAALADLTATRKQYGYSSTLPQQSGMGSSLISGAGAIGSAAIIAA